MKVMKNDQILKEIEISIITKYLSICYDIAVKDMEFYPSFVQVVFENSIFRRVLLSRQRLFFVSNEFTCSVGRKSIRLFGEKKKRDIIIYYFYSRID